jgi:hypothetical protein
MVIMEPPQAKTMVELHMDKNHLEEGTEAEQVDMEVVDHEVDTEANPVEDMMEVIMYIFVVLC